MIKTNILVQIYFKLIISIHSHECYNRFYVWFMSQFLSLRLCRCLARTPTKLLHVYDMNNSSNNWTSTSVINSLMKHCQLKFVEVFTTGWSYIYILVVNNSRWHVVYIYYMQCAILCLSKLFLSFLHTRLS